jgi:hypothetical protein
MKMTFQEIRIIATGPCKTYHKQCIHLLHNYWHSTYLTVLKYTFNNRIWCVVIVSRTWGHPLYQIQGNIMLRVKPLLHLLWSQPCPAFISFSLSWLITVTWQVPLVKQEVLTLREHMSSPPVFVGFMFLTQLLFICSANLFLY